MIINQCISSAKDHEAVRIALGNEPFNFGGLSYGSQLGAQYAQLFPDNIRTLALDGILQHSQAEAANLIIEATSYELGMSHFLEWASKNESSALQGQDAEAIWLSLLANATETPLPAPLCNGTNCAVDVNAEEILLNAHRHLTFAGKDRGLGASWELLASALHNATQGDASALSMNFEALDAISFLSIGCLDWTHSSNSSSDIVASQVMVNTYAPLTRGATQQWQLQHACLGWPVEVKNPPKKLDVKSNTTALLISATSDPSTGLPWALGMMEEIENAVLVLREGDGHTSFALGGEAALVLAEYFITGEAPEEGIITSS